MGTRCVGFVVVGATITMVDAEIPDSNDEPLSIIADNTWTLQEGDRAAAYAVLYQRCHDYLNENGITSVVIKASALPTGAAKEGLLTSAEVRGVIIAASSAAAPNVKILKKALISRTYGNRKVDEYLQDDSFWEEQTAGGKLRKTSREAAMLIVASRK